MKKISVITGGFGGMGLAIAKLLGKNSEIVLIDEAKQREDESVNILKDLGISVKTYIVDISDRAAIKRVAEETAASGEIIRVINTAAYSPHMAEAKRILEVDVMGTVIVTEEFFKVMGKGSVLINTASMAGHFLPPSSEMNALIDKHDYEALVNAFEKKGATTPIEHGGPSGSAYTMAKYFVIRYTRANVKRFGQKGIRIICVSPGSYETYMYPFEKISTDAILSATPIDRLGHPDEIAATYEYLCNATYITGSDILADGGCVAARSIPQI